MIEIPIVETDLLTEILSKLHFYGTKFHVHTTRDMWKVEIL